MALLNCPDCGRLVSGESDRCPACGFRLGAYRGRKKPVELDYCVRCRKFLPFGLKKCPRCGRDPRHRRFFERRAGRLVILLVILPALLALAVASC